MKIYKPTRGRHDGSSFREILDIWKEKNYCEVIDITEIKSTHHDETMWVESRPWVDGIGEILLYDNPILDKYHDGLNWKFALYANTVDHCDNCSSWTFWPKHPKIHEIVRSEGIPNYDERKFESCFIGTMTTHLRNVDWSKSVEHYWMGYANEKLFNHKDYLNYLKKHKFGLCLPGVGPKCLRDIELIGLGTVPIFTPGVSTDYYNKLEKDVHYLYVENPLEVADVIKSCTKEKWEEMSKNCLDWFEQNASPLGVFNVTSKIINNFKNGTN